MDGEICFQCLFAKKSDGKIPQPFFWHVCQEDATKWECGANSLAWTVRLESLVCILDAEHCFLEAPLFCFGQGQDIARADGF